MCRAGRMRSVCPRISYPDLFMPALTEIERNVAKAVAQNFLVNKEVTSYEQLLRKFEDPRPIIKLTNSRLFSTDNNHLNPTYLPTIFAFQYCGDNVLCQTAKDAVTIIVRDLKNLFKTNYDKNRRYDANDLPSFLESANYVPIPAQ